jgi:hypothetical protein
MEKSARNAVVTARAWLRRTTASESFMLASPEALVVTG